MCIILSNIRDFFNNPSVHYYPSETVMEINGHKRRELGFAELVSKYFWYLETEYGYRLGESHDTAVRYQSSLLCVTVHHDRLSYEVDFFVSPRSSETSVTYALAPILKALAQGNVGATFFQASTRSSLEDCVATIADVVHRWCDALLKADKVTLNKVHKAYCEMGEETTSHYVVTPIKEKAHDAWRRRDYEEVIRLCQSIESELTEVERKRLDYARRKTVERN